MKFTAKIPFSKTRAKVVAILKRALTEELKLSVTTRDFYRNVTGPNFHSLHRLFGDHYRQLERWLDELGACRRALAGEKNVDAENVAKQVRGEGTGRTDLPPRKMLDQLLAWHEQLAGRLREDVQICSKLLGETGTANVLSRLVEFHETTAWMLRMVLHGPQLARI